jgi:hypothetical protein
MLDAVWIHGRQIAREGVALLGALHQGKGFLGRDQGPARVDARLQVRRQAMGDPLPADGEQTQVAVQQGRGERQLTDEFRERGGARIGQTSGSHVGFRRPSGVNGRLGHGVGFSTLFSLSVSSLADWRYFG